VNTTMTKDEFDQHVEDCLALEPNWDGLGSLVPDHSAAELARQAYIFIDSLGQTPEVVTGSRSEEVGGILVICTTGGGYPKIYVDCFNDGSVIVMTSKHANDAHIWQLKLEIPDQLI